MRTKILPLGCHKDNRGGGGGIVQQIISSMLISNTGIEKCKKIDACIQISK